MLLAASAIVLSLFASGPASADAPAASGPKSVKRKCVSTGTASETYRLKASPTATAQAYKVSVKAKYCLVYTMVSKSVRGKSVSQPKVSSVEKELTVSHSGFLPERNGRAATELLPIGPAYSSATIDYTLPFRRDDGQGQGFLFFTEEWWGVDPIHSQRSYRVWDELLESGFSCSKGKCRPLKRSIIVKGSEPISILEEGRVFIRADVEVYSGAERSQSKGSLLYWDNGDPCGVDFPQCMSSVKPVTSFKSQKGSLGDWEKNGTFLGIPASLRARDRCDCPVG
jgi:hypothetical protein